MIYSFLFLKIKLFTNLCYILNSHFETIVLTSLQKHHEAFNFLTNLFPATSSCLPWIQTFIKRFHSFLFVVEVLLGSLGFPTIIPLQNKNKKFNLFAFVKSCEGNTYELHKELFCDHQRLNYSPWNINVTNDFWWSSLNELCNMWFNLHIIGQLDDAILHQNHFLC